jgi:hypothetical protein
MKKEKYYSPTERELLQGIVNEQEIFVVSKDGDIVTNLKFNNGLINDLVSFAYLNDIEYKDEYEVIYSINSDYYRIKYLDQEDIESLGWKRDPSGERYWEMKEIQLYYQEENNYLYIMDYSANYIFRGIIKNKSELKKLMEMLEIC